LSPPLLIPAEEEGDSSPCNGLHGEAPPKGVPFSGLGYIKG